MNVCVHESTPRTESVARFAQAYLDGDIAAVLGSIAPGCVIHQAEALPWGGDWTGPEGFVAMVTRMVTNLDVELVSIDIMDAGQVAVGKLAARWTARATGEAAVMTVVEHYTVENGLITDLDVYYKDTALIRRLDAGEPPAVLAD
jgi:ketosteroid isomerase-like protein